MTERLYYKDPALMEFDAKIIEAGINNGKDFVVLDRTAFYPASGGQPHDLGLINNVKVIDVIENESGAIKHIIEKSVGKTNDTIHGQIDIVRRQYFRQLHTAQHILSRAFMNLLNSETVSVHLGEEYGAVELNSSSVTVEQCQQAENLSNQIIHENSPIEIIFADNKQAALLPLRKKPERTGTIRIIKIGELDWSACGGTHCSNTAEVGLIKVIGAEKQREHALVKFLAGTKAKEDYDSRFNVTDQLSKSLTCSLSDLPFRVSKLSHENKQLRSQLSALQKELLPVKVKELSKTATKVKDCNVVFADVTGFDSKLLTQLTAELASNINGLAALLLENRICTAASPDSKLDASLIVKELSTKFNLKGGGNKNMAQLGGVDPVKFDDYKQALMAVVDAM